MSPALFLFFPPGFSWCFSHVYSSEWTKVILWIFSFSKKKKISKIKNSISLVISLGSYQI